MVANIRSGSSPGGALRYNKEKVDKDEAEVLLWQKMLEPFDKHGRLDIDACMDSFWPYLEANRRTTNTVFHASLNPSPEDRLTDEQLREIANEYMQKMGYGDQPYIVFKHKDIDRQHLHIVSLRVDEKGCKLPHDFEARRSAEITRDLEHKYNLHPAVKGQEQRDTPDLRKVNYKTGNVKHQISSVVRSCLRNYKCSSYGEFRTLLELFNVSVEERTGTIDERNYAGIVYGAMTDDGYGIGTPFKSSRIGRDVGYKALQKYYERSKSALKQDGSLDRLRQTVRDAMSPHNTRDEFRQLLKAENVILSADLAVIFFKYQTSSSSINRSSNGLLILLLKVSAMWTYLSVVLMLLCPISSFTILMSVPCSSKWVANEWRSRCG